MDLNKLLNISTDGPNVNPKCHKTLELSVKNRIQPQNRFKTNSENVNGKFQKSE